MKYKFITVLHNLKLGTVKNKGIKIFKRGRISNSPQIMELILSEPMKSSMGELTRMEFIDSVYLIIDGEYDMTDKDDIDETKGSLTFFILRQIQEFIYHMWLIKDNNIYVRDGFLMTSNQVYKASLSEVFTYASNEKEKDSTFSDEEIKHAISKFLPSEFTDEDIKNLGGKYPQSDHFFKSDNFERIDRASYFIMAARRMSTLPMKIVSYVNALECLFTTGRSELSHKVSERVAFLLGKTSLEKRDVYNIIKKAYDYRSSLVHGQYIKGDDKILVEVSMSLDSILRTIFINYEDIFNMSDKDIEEYFLNLIIN